MPHGSSRRPELTGVGFSTWFSRVGVAKKFENLKIVQISGVLRAVLSMLACGNEVFPNPVH
ncbi:MAG: hypothetical protein ACK5JO_18780, partial [Halodesulfovibrio sp.]